MDGLPSSVLDSTPAMMPPNGQTSNLVDPPDYAVEAYAVAAACLSITLFFFGIRLFTKLFLLRKLYSEDFTCAISVILYMCANVGVVLGAYDGIARHQWNVSIGQALRIGYVVYWGEVIFSFATMMAKISILQQVQRIFAGTQKGVVHRSCSLLIWLNGSFYVAASLAGIFSCSPREAAWDPLVEGTCINKMMLIVVSCGINVVSDVVIMIIPMVCTWRLVLPRKQKLAVIAVFACAIFSLGMAILKLVMTIPLLTTEDLTYTLNAAGLCATAEVGSVITCGCLPCVPRFFKAVRTRSLSSLTYATGSSSRDRGTNASSRHPQRSTGNRSSQPMDEKLQMQAMAVPVMDEEDPPSPIIHAITSDIAHFPPRNSSLYVDGENFMPTPFEHPE